MIHFQSQSPHGDLGELPQEVKDQVKERDGRRCCSCGSTTELHVHHIHPKYLGGTHDPSNLITLCMKCHSARHIDMQLRLGARAVVRMNVALRRVLSMASGRGASVRDYSGLVQLLTSQPFFRSGQRAIVDAVLAGKDVLVIRPTGSGKSLCYQLPALLLERPTLVLAPLIALMRDQVRKLHGRGVPATFLCSDLSDEERRLRHGSVQKGWFRIFYMAPESLDPEKVPNAEALKERFGFPVGMLVVDEADLITEAGETYRPSLLRIGEVRRRYGSPQILAFTATASPRMRKEIAASLEMRDPVFFDQGADRPNIILATYTLNPADGKEFEVKVEAIKWFLSVRASTSRTVVFVPTLDIGDKLTDALNDAGVKCAFYHAKQKDKDSLQDRFSGALGPPLAVLVATPAFSRGVDIPDIRFVIHWSAPATLAHYYQDIGRAGRDGYPALALLLRYPGTAKHPGDDQQVWKMCERSIRKNAKAVCLSPEQTLERLAKYKEEHKRVLEFVERGEKLLSCQRRFLMKYFGYRVRSRFWPVKVASRFLARSRALPLCCSSCNRLFFLLSLERAIREVDL